MRRPGVSEATSHAPDADTDHPRSVIAGVARPDPDFPKVLIPAGAEVDGSRGRDRSGSSTVPRPAASLALAGPAAAALPPFGISGPMKAGED